MNFLSQRQQRSLKVLAMPRRRNRYVVMALCVWFGLATLFFVWCGLQNNQFVSQLQQSRSQLSGVFKAAPVQFKVAKDTGDTAATVTALRNLSATISQNIKSLPTELQVFGLHVGADAERARRYNLQEAAQGYVIRLNELAEFVAYQSAIARQLQELSLQDVSGYSQTIDLANSWQAAMQKVQNESKPALMTDVIATLLQKMGTIEATIREMAELYKKSDTDGFKAKQAQLAATIAEFKAIGTQIETLGAQLDAQLAAASAKLQQNL